MPVLLTKVSPWTPGLLLAAVLPRTPIPAALPPETAVFE
jgi:hypothetical protein